MLKSRFLGHLSLICNYSAVMGDSYKPRDVESGEAPPPYAAVSPSAPPPTIIGPSNDYGAVSPTGPVPTYQDATDVHGELPYSSYGSICVYCSFINYCRTSAFL